MTLTDQQFAERLRDGLAEDATKPPLTWWLSFADPDKPKTQQFLGVVLVDNCGGLIEARMQLTINGVQSPGGEIRGFGFDPNDGPPDQVAALARLPRLVLLSKKELEDAGMELSTP